MREAQANVVAVALGVSLIVILLLSTAYLLSSTSVKTVRVLELLSEQAGVSIHINGSGYLVGNTRPEYIVVKDSSGNIEVYLAGDLGVELNKPFPELSGVVYGVAANGAVRLLKPTLHLSTNATSSLIVWPGQLYSFKPLAPYNNTSWINVSSSNVVELIAWSGYLRARVAYNELYLLATVNYTVTSIGWRLWRISALGETWSRSGPQYSHVVLSSPGSVVLRVYAPEDIVLNVYACNTTQCYSIGAYSVPALQYINISVIAYPYLLFNITSTALWPNWVQVDVLVYPATWFSNNTMDPRKIIDATTTATTTLPSLACSNFTKIPVLNPYPYTEDVVDYYRVECGYYNLSWVNWSSGNVYVVGEYYFEAPKPVVLFSKAVVVNATTYPAEIPVLAIPTLSTIMLRIEYNVTPWIGPARGAYITLRVYANGIELLNTTGEVTPTLSTFRFTIRVSIAGYIFNITAMSTYTLTAIVNSVNITVETSSAPFMVLVPSSNANVSGLINISEYKAIGWTHAYVYSRWTGGSRIIDVVVSQN